MIRLTRAGIGYDSVMTMPWTLARDLACAAARAERERLLDLSVAARAAQADEKGWKKWVESVSA